MVVTGATVADAAAKGSPPEIFFSILARRLLKRGVFTREADLAEQMLAFVEIYNQTRPAIQPGRTEARSSKHEVNELTGQTT